MNNVSCAGRSTPLAARRGLFALAGVACTALVAVAGPGDDTCPGSCSAHASAACAGEGKVVAASFDEPLKASPLKVGDTVKDVALKDVEGKTVNLGAMYATRPTVVMFYRGGWCPYCNTSLAAWGQKLQEFKAAGVGVVAISMEKPESAKALHDKIKMDYALLIDEDGKAAREFGVAYSVDEPLQTKLKGYKIDLAKSNASGRWELPVPGTFLIDTSGKVRYAFAEEDYTKRADPDVVLAEAKKVMAEKKK